MLKMLKADFYKIFKSKMLLAFFIIALSLSLLNPILHAVDMPDYTVYYNFRQPGILYGVLWIFIIPFVCKDLSSRYMKNLIPVYSEKDKFCYILSKVFYIFVFCVLFMLLNFVFEIISNYSFGIGCMYDTDWDVQNFTVAEFYLHYLCSIINSVAIGTVLLFLCVLSKREYIVTVFVLPYLFFLSSLLYDAINKAVADGFRLELYTIFGLWNMLLNCHTSELLIGLCMSLGYTAFFTVSSWLVFRKRSF